MAQGKRVVYSAKVRKQAAELLKSAKHCFGVEDGGIEVIKIGGGK